MRENTYQLGTMSISGVRLEAKMIVVKRAFFFPMYNMPKAYAPNKSVFQSGVNVFRIY